MLFDALTYRSRRAELRALIGSGIILLPGNSESPCNYPANAYPFRQDSTFLYYYGQDRENLIGVIDCDQDREWLLGDDVELQDIIWTGYVPSVSQLAQECGVSSWAPYDTIDRIVKDAVSQGRRIHYLPPYRHDLMIRLSDLLGIHPSRLKENASLPLINAVVQMRSVKSPAEIEEIERAMAIGYSMHMAAITECRPGVTEKHIAGIMEGIAVSRGSRVSFNSIVTMHGEIFHGGPSLQPLEQGRLLLVDAGAETIHNYCSDNTRTMPVSGRFSSRQRDIYSIVESCHDLVIEKAAPGMRWLDMHMAVCSLMTERLKDLGLMKGNTSDALEAGAHALFLPHGLGHMMGMDVHDMEGLGQIHVGYDDQVRPSTQFGTENLRIGRALKPGFVLTDEPGIYFIPALIDRWRSEGRNRDFINYDALEPYMDFGGIRIEDDILITVHGCRVLGKQIIPYHPDELEAIMSGPK